MGKLGLVDDIGLFGEKKSKGLGLEDDIGLTGKLGLEDDVGLFEDKENLFAKVGKRASTFIKEAIAKPVARGLQTTAAGLEDIWQTGVDNIRNIASLQLAEDGAVFGISQEEFETRTSEQKERIARNSQLVESMNRAEENSKRIKEQWLKGASTGWEARTPEVFQGKFMQNPSWTRALALGFESAPILGMAAATSIITKSPITGAVFIGALESAGEFVAAREAGKSIKESNEILVIDTIMLSALEVVPMTGFMKGGKLPLRMFRGAVQEGGEEVLQGVWKNMVAKLGYDETRELTEGLVESFIAGFVSGGLVGSFTPAEGIDRALAEAEEKGIDTNEIITATGNQVINEGPRLERVAKEIIDESEKYQEWLRSKATPEEVELAEKADRVPLHPGEEGKRMAEELEPKIEAEKKKVVVEAGKESIVQPAKKPQGEQGIVDKNVKKELKDAIKYRKDEVSQLTEKADKARKAGKEEIAQIYEGQIKDYMSIDEDEFSADFIANPNYYINSNIDPFLRFKNKEVNRASPNDPRSIQEIRQEVPQGKGEIENVWKDFKSSEIGPELVKIYRGKNAYQESNNYYSPNKEWARQFTQSGQDKEIFETFINKSNVYIKSPLPQATSEEEFDLAVKEAKEKGFKAIMTDEGKGEPNSIYRISRKELKGEIEKQPWEVTKDEYIEERVRGGHTGEGAKLGHKATIEQAIREGKPVPAEVLKDYPGLTKEAKPAEKKPAKATFKIKIGAEWKVPFGVTKIGNQKVKKATADNVQDILQNVLDDIEIDSVQDDSGTYVIVKGYPKKELESKEKRKLETYGSFASGSSGAIRASGKKGYGTIEYSEKKQKEKRAKTDYSKVVDEMPQKNFNFVDDILKIASPAHRSRQSRLGARVIRKNLSELAQKDVVATEMLKKAHKAFTWMNFDDMLDFIDRMENGQTQRRTELQPIANKFRELLDQRREVVQNLGKGHLENFFENYFPHIWKDPAKAKNVIATMLGRKRLEGSKSFLKKRVIMTVKDGVDRNLELVSENPVDLVLLKLHEMDRYIMAQNIIRELKARNLIKFVYSRSKAPDGYNRINDNAFTVFLPPEITKKDAYDRILVDDLMGVAESLGIDTKRFVTIGKRGALGYAQWYPSEGPGGEKVRTKFASPESVLAHEIGHVLGYRYDLFNLLGRRNDGERKVHQKGKKKGKEYFKPEAEAVEHRRTIDKEWRDLADARAKGLDPAKHPGFFKYIRKGREKEAVMLEAMIHAPDEFKRVAPTLYKLFTAFLNDHSELRPILDIKPSLVLSESDAKIKIPGFTTLGFYNAPEQVATLLNNYLSPGIRNNQNRLIAGSYNLLRGVGNILNQVQLSLSLFHGLNVTSDIMASTFGLGIRKLASRGQRISGLTDILTYPISPLKTIWDGMRIKKAYQTQLDQIQDDRLRNIVRAVILAGGRDRMDVIYYNQQIKALNKTFSDIVKGDAFKKLTGIAKLPFNVFGATLESISKPLMEWYVPTGKLGLFAKLAQHEFERAENGEINDDQLWEMLTTVWDSVDNRMGQLIYDNLFWNKVLKDTAMLTIRSVGWNLGSWREYAGSATDLLTTTERIKRGDKFFSHKMSYAVGAVVTYSILGAIIQKLLTGKPPEEPKDYLFPKTGKLNLDGSEERLSMPTYAKDWYAYGTQPVKTVAHKIHPLWGLLGDFATNKDFFNVEVVHEDDPLLQKAQSAVGHLLKEARSISMKNFEKMEKTAPGETVRNIAVSVTGITSAPTYITRSPAQKLMYRYIIENIPPKSKTQESFDRSTYRRNFINRLRKGDNVDKAEARRVLGNRSYVQAIKEARKEPFAASFNRLNINDAVRVYLIANPEERKMVRNLLKAKYGRSRTATNETKVLYKELMAEK